MVDFRFRRLERYRTGGTRDNLELSVPIPKSSTGKILRYCPDQACTPRRFQLGQAPESRTISEAHFSLIRRQPSTPGITCPYCGLDAKDYEFNAPEDIDAATNLVMWEAGQDVGDWLEQWTRDFNRQFNRSRGLISLQASVQRSRKPRPRPWREDLLRSLTCNVCSRVYGVYAIALFCPDCGARNLSIHFRREMEITLAQVDLAEHLQERGEQEIAYRLLGNAHEDVLTAFETYLKSVFRFVARRRFPGELPVDIAKDLRGNPFQNIDRSRKAFEYLKVDLFTILNEKEIADLHIDIEKRHIVGHNLGIADEKYIDVAQDSGIGETIPLLADEIEQFANLCSRVIGHIEQVIPEFLPPTTPAKS